jgi:hypothetical protein
MFKHPNFSYKKSLPFWEDLLFLSFINIIPYGYGLLPIMTETICICLVFITDINVYDFYFKYYIAIKSPEISLEGNSDLPIK